MTYTKYCKKCSKKEAYKSLIKYFASFKDGRTEKIKNAIKILKIKILEL